MRILPSSLVLLLALQGPVAAQVESGQEQASWWACSGVAEYTFWVYEQIQQSEGHTDHEERIRILRIASGVFVQAQIEDTGCTETRQAARDMVQTEAIAASDYFAMAQQNGERMEDVLALYDQFLDQCLVDLGNDRLQRLMAEFTENGPPCGWTQ